MASAETDICEMPIKLVLQLTPQCSNLLPACEAGYFGVANDWYYIMTNFSPINASDIRIADVANVDNYRGLQKMPIKLWSSTGFEIFT